MPVPRRFDRRPPERDPTRINERIRVPEVRLIGEDGEQIGLMKIDDALRYAAERDLDLVEVAPEAKPPVCRVLDYSKYKYELAQKQKQARKHQQQITIREIKFRPKIAQHDYDTKKGHVERFLRHKDKVKVTIMFRGREVTHPERGVQILDRLAEELAEYAIVEQRPLHDGRNMTMMLGPSKAVLAGQYDKGAENGAVVLEEGANGAEPGVVLTPATAATSNGGDPAGVVAPVELEPAAVEPVGEVAVVEVAEPAVVEVEVAAVEPAEAAPEAAPEPAPAAPAAVRKPAAKPKAPAAAKPKAATAAAAKPAAKAKAPAKPKAAAGAPRAAAKPKPKPAAS